MITNYHRAKPGETKCLDCVNSELSPPSHGGRLRCKARRDGVVGLGHTCDQVEPREVEVPK